MNEEYKKPPLGATPRNIIEIQRCQELSKAIYEYLHHDYLARDIYMWIEELGERIKNCKFEEYNSISSGDESEAEGS